MACNVSFIEDFDFFSFCIFVAVLIATYYAEKLCQCLLPIDVFRFIVSPLREFAATA